MGSNQPFRQIVRRRLWLAGVFIVAVALGLYVGGQLVGWLRTP